jgi:voltage-gated potassium channel
MPFMSKSEFRQKLNRFFHTATDAGISVLILCVILLALESAYPPESRTETMLEWVQIGITLVFIAELALRWQALGNFRRFISEYWVDVLAVLPIIRPLRLLRLLRLARLVRVGVIFTRRGRRLASMIHEGMLENMMIMGCWWLSFFWHGGHDAGRTGFAGLFGVQR